MQNSTWLLALVLVMIINTQLKLSVYQVKSVLMSSSILDEEYPFINIQTEHQPLNTVSNIHASWAFIIMLHIMCITVQKFGITVWFH